MYAISIHHMMYIETIFDFITLESYFYSTSLKNCPV